MTDKTFCSLSFFKVDLHMHTVPQNRDKFTTNNLFYCCKALIFTHPLVYEFLCGPKHMAHPVSNLFLGQLALKLPVVKVFSVKTASKKYIHITT